MDLNFINPFIQAAIEIIKEFMGIEVRKEEVYVQEGRKSKGGVGIVLDITLDVEGSVIFDFTNEITQTFASEMVGINISNEQEMLNNKELLESAIKELGNTISGRAITTLEKQKISCDISPPKVYIGKNSMLAQNEHIVIAIEFVTDYGAFSMCLTNKDHNYLESVSVLMYSIPEKIKNSIVHHFLPKGFEIFEQTNQNNINEILMQKEINFLLLNLEEIKNADYLETLKSGSLNKNVSVMGFYENEEKVVPELLKKMDYKIQNHLSELEMVKKISGIFGKAGIKPSERRKHVRVKTNNRDNINISFYMKDNVLLKGTVNDLSVGGAVFRMKNEENLEMLNLDTRIEGVRINLGGKLVRTSGIVVYKKDNFIAVRFVDLKKDFIKAVADFIFNKLTEIGGIKD